MSVLFNNIKLSVRVLTRSKLYTVINLSGLVMGLTISFILLIFAINELSYNDCFPESRRIYRVITKDISGNHIVQSPFMLKAALENNIPCIGKSGRLFNFKYAFGDVSGLMAGTWRNLPEFFCMDPEMAGILHIKINRGSLTWLAKGHSYVMISKRAAQKYFPGKGPVGKTMRIRISGQDFSMIISAVFDNLPWNSTIQADYIAGPGFFREIYHQFLPGQESELLSVNDYSAQTFILIKKNSTIEDVQAMVPGLQKKLHFPGNTFSFQNIRDSYLHSGGMQGEYFPTGSMENIFIYLSLSGFILLLASLNYSMLSTARSTLRFKEIGVRKVLGATRTNLRNQLLTESVIMVLIAFPLSFLLIGLIDPVVDRYFGYTIHFDSGNIALYLLITSSVSLIIGLVSGAYAAFYLSALSPVTALRSNYLIYKKISLSKIFIVFQIFITLALFIGLINVSLQIRMCLTGSNGIHKKNLMVLQMNSDNPGIYPALKTEIQKLKYVTSVSGSSIPLPTLAVGSVKVGIPGSDTAKLNCELVVVDRDFFRTLGSEMKAGREFMHGDNEKLRVIILNETAARLFGYRGSKNLWLGGYKVIGVVNDFNIHTLHQRIRPMIFKYLPDNGTFMVIRCESGKEHELIDIIKKKWTIISPDTPLEYHFFDQELNALYITEQNFSRVVATFTLLAFIITGMGLFGLAMLIAERRMKEMSVRKVFGASWGNIIFLIQKEFIVYILIAAAFAIPLAWYFLSLWLNKFYYRITMQWYLFILSVIVVGIFVSLILFLKTLRILRESPANALKYE